MPARLAPCLALALALTTPAAATAAAAPYDLSFGVAALRGNVTAEVSLTRAAAGELPAVELYGGLGTVRMGLRPGTRATALAGRLRWRPGTGGTLAVPTALRFGWDELAGAAGAKRRCRGATAAPVSRRLVHVLAAEREGARVRIRWAVPLPRLGRFGCAGAGALRRVVAEDVYPADVFDHRQVRVRVVGSERRGDVLPGGRSRSTIISWNFAVTLVRLDD